jgi:hypothetical protein
VATAPSRVAIPAQRRRQRPRRAPGAAVTLEPRRDLDAVRPRSSATAAGVPPRTGRPPPPPRLYGVVRRARAGSAADDPPRGPLEPRRRVGERRRPVRPRGRQYVRRLVRERARAGRRSLAVGVVLHGSELFWFDGPECGFWHSHPEAKFAAPSSADIAAWKERLARLPFGTRRYLGLIVVKGERGWGRPEIAAWTVDGTTAAPQRIRVIET